MNKYVKLPNDQIVAVDENGFIGVQVEVDLSKFIDNDPEAVLDMLSEEATGTEVLCNISYSVVGHHGDTLSIKVTGSLECIDVEEIDPEKLPMLEFEVLVTRVGYCHRTAQFSARTADEARVIAGDDAGNHLYSEHESEYHTEVLNVSNNRLFIGVFSTGISYADRHREEQGDYAKLAFLPYDTLQLEVYACPVELQARIQSHAATIQARRGQQFQVSSSGQTVMLGSD